MPTSLAYYTWRYRLKKHRYRVRLHRQNMIDRQAHNLDPEKLRFMANCTPHYMAINEMTNSFPNKIPTIIKARKTYTERQWCVFFSNRQVLGTLLSDQYTRNIPL